MSIQVTGALTDPIGAAMSTTIRITALESKLAIKGSEAKIVTGAEGGYNFTLFEGEYCVQLLQNKEYTKGTEILVDSGVATPITLGTLLANHERPVV